MRWLKRIRGALGMGVTWAIGWGLAGIGIGVASILLPFLPWQYFFDVFDAPLPALAVPGFIGGMIFSLILGVAGRRRRFYELSIPWFTALGALGGTLLALVPAAMVAVGLASTEGSSHSLTAATAVAVIPLALFGAASAGITLRLARASEKREEVAAGESVRSLE